MTYFADDLSCWWLILQMTVLPDYLSCWWLILLITFLADVLSCWGLILLSWQRWSISRGYMQWWCSSRFQYLHTSWTITWGQCEGIAPRDLEIYGNRWVYCWFTQACCQFAMEWYSHIIAHAFAPIAAVAAAANEATWTPASVPLARYAN